MPTRAELMAEMEPDAREQLETMLKLEESTYTTPEKLEESIKRTEFYINGWFELCKGTISDENKEVVLRASMKAFAYARELLKEWENSSPPTGELSAFFLYFFHALGFASFTSAQLLAFLHAVEAGSTTLEVHAMELMAQEIQNPKTDPSKAN